MQMMQQPERAYVNRESQDYKVVLDPIRIRLRVMPVSSGCQPKGMNSDFFFLEAAKKSLRGDLCQAVDLLKRGLKMTPGHYQCKFNHGVLMFKFGLIKEAIVDFECLVKSHPNQAWPHFNLAICLVQMGLPDLKAQRAKSMTKLQRRLTVRKASSIVAALPKY